MAMQARDKGLLQRHEEIPRKELAAVSVAGELEIEAGLCCNEDTARLMGEENFEVSGGSIGSCSNGIGMVRCEHVAGVEIRHAGKEQTAAAMLNDAMLVHQNREAEPLHFYDPRFCAGIVFMIAGDEKLAVTRGEFHERFDLVPQIIHAAVGEVAGESDNVRREASHLRDDLFHEITFDRGADVEIADLHDAQTR